MEAGLRLEVCNRWLPAMIATRVTIPELSEKERPFWFLESSIELILRDDRPFYGSPLQLIRPAERIEYGWCYCGDFFDLEPIPTDPFTFRHLY